MKIRKFNENKESDSRRILCIYDSGGYVYRTIVFDDNDQMYNYILNFVNGFLSEIDIDEESINEHEYEVIKDEDGKFILTDPIEAYNWLNDWNSNSEPTLGICNYEEEKNVKLDDRIAIAISSNKYNL